MEEMEDKPLNEKESLELITRMIHNTRKKLEKGSGTDFLIWGYITIIVTMLVWTLLVTTNNYQWQWLWFLIPVSGLLLKFIYARKSEKHEKIVTYVDKVIRYIWLVLGITGFLLSCISIVHPMQILFIIALIMSIGHTLTGLVINYRLAVVCGIIGMMLSIALLFLPWTSQLPTFALVFVCISIIPGHCLNYKARHRNV